MSWAFVAKAAEIDADRKVIARRAHFWLLAFLMASCLSSLAIGASDTSLWSAIGGWMSGAPLTRMEQTVLWDIRMPRTLLGVLVGAALAVSGAILQGLFRNPLADPGIIGVTAGASLGAISAIVLGTSLPAIVQAGIGPYLVPMAALLGSWASVVLLYAVATQRGRTSVATLLLAGIALAALTSAVSGLLIYASDDQQLRDLNFWLLGALGGATWAKLALAAPLILLALICATFLGRALNGLALGEAAALHLGIPVQRAKNIAILCVAAAVGTAVAFSGGIGFVGIVVPHLLRLATGPDHEPLLINSALLGGALLVWADVAARLVVAPAELPIGIVTAVIGAPIFLWILLRSRGVLDL